MKKKDRKARVERRERSTYIYSFEDLMRCRYAASTPDAAAACAEYASEVMSLPVSYSSEAHALCSLSDGCENSEERLIRGKAERAASLSLGCEQWKLTCAHIHCLTVIECEGT